MDITKLDRSARVFAIAGLLAFIDLFLPWATVSINGQTIPGFSGNAWDLGFLGWFPMLLLLAVGVIAALPAVGTQVNLPGGLALAGTAAAVLSLLLVLLRWITLPSYFGASEDASFGLYIGLVLGVVAAVFGWMGYTAQGGSFNTIGDSFKAKQIPPQG